MKISGFAIIKNAVINDYPVVEAISSILPMVNEMIVSVGDSEDETASLIRSIPSDKIRIHYSTWDKNLKKGGEVLAVETDKAFGHISPDSDWAFYIQADEVVHEKYHNIILQTAAQYKDNKQVDGLLFNYLHFYGTYNHVGDSRKWYHKEVRLIRNDPGIRAYRDAQGFRRGTKKLMVKPVNAFIYHYGWVKNPRQMKEKQKKFQEFWQDSNKEDQLKEVFSADIFDFNEFDSLTPFEETHPAVMQKRIAEKDWNIDLDISKKHFSLKEKFLYWYEKKTGVRLFDFRNYKII